MTSKLPWILPGIRRPNFNFYQIKLRIPTSIPRGVIYFVVYAIIFYIFSGGAYHIVNKEIISIGQAGNRPIFIAPYSSVQYLIEGLVAGIVFSFGALSLYIFDYATKYVFEVNTAQKLELLGVVLVSIWYIVITLMYKQKVGG
ncbi:MAG: hypothetical protein ACTSYD_03180 [Candidatus Heimdallarchaeaceae archaeon]